MSHRYAWAQRGDINAFFGLILDNVAVMSLLLLVITTGSVSFSRDFVFTQMIPGTALGVVAGDLVYTWLAFRLARRSGRDDVTAMPLGLDTPSTFAVATLILLPSLKHGMDNLHYDHGQAMVFAWHVGAVLLVMIGICKSIVAPLGTAVRKWVPRGPARLAGRHRAGTDRPGAALGKHRRRAAGRHGGLDRDPGDACRPPSPAGPHSGGLGGGSPGRGPVLGFPLAGLRPPGDVGSAARASAGRRMEAAGVLSPVCPKLVLVAAGASPMPWSSCP